MPSFSLKQRLKIAIGGFISFIGLMILVVAVLTMTNAINLGSVVQNDLIVVVAVVVGIADIFCGFLLFWKRWE